MGMCHFLNLFGGISIHLLQLFQATYRVPSFWLDSPILVECSPVMRGAPCHGCRFGWRWPCLFSFSSLHSSFARWLGKILTYDGFLGTKMDFSVQNYSCTCRCFLLPCFNWSHEKPSFEEPKQAKRIMSLCACRRHQDTGPPSWWFSTSSDQEWSDADLYVGSLWKAVLTILQARFICCTFLVGRSMDGHHWTTNMYIPYMLFKKNTMNVQRAGVTRCDTSVQQWDMDIFLQPLSCSETRAEKGGPPRPWCLWGGPVACLVTVPGGWHAFSGVDHHNQPAPYG